MVHAKSQDCITELAKSHSKTPCKTIKSFAKNDKIEYAPRMQTQVVTNIGLLMEIIQDTQL